MRFIKSLKSPSGFDRASGWPRKTNTSGNNHAVSSNNCKESCAVAKAHYESSAHDAFVGVLVLPAGSFLPMDNDFISLSCDLVTFEMVLQLN
jgi:hypothetical protein